MGTNRFAIISHVLPPAPSGQSVVLQRLLDGFQPESYCLISSAAAKLQPALHFPAPTDSWFFSGSIVLNTWLGIRSRSRQIEAIVRHRGCQLIVVCSGDICDLPAAALAARRTGIPLLPYMFDDYRWQWTGFYRRLSRRLESFVLQQASGIIVPNEFLAEEYGRRCQKPVVIVRNPALLPELEILDQSPRILDEGSVNVVYTGSVYRAHYDAFRNLIGAIERLGRSDVKLHIFTAQSAEDLKVNGIGGAVVIHHPHQPPNDVARLQRQADLLFLPLAFSSPIPEVIRTSAPGKMGEYLAAGRPILVHAPADSFVSWYFCRHGCGIVVDHSDPVRLAETMQEIFSDFDQRERLGRQARACAERDFSIGKAQADFAGFIGRMTNPVSLNL